EYSYLRQEGSINMMMETTSRILLVAQALRQTGCGAMDLCLLARGGVDAVYGGLLIWKPWDWAAGVLIVEEAGGKVFDGGGGEFELMGDTLMCTSTAELAEALLD
ncbi:unnamed protein product, partial [Discosporangium mesarthrocarpum]